MKKESIDVHVGKQEGRTGTYGRIVTKKLVPFIGKKVRITIKILKDG